MIGWSIMFSFQFAPEFAREQYDLYKTHFSHNYLIFRLFKERHDNNESINGDIDSGPIVRGYSIPANQFAFCDAVAAGDLKTAKKMERLVNWGTKKQDNHNEIKYKVRWLQLNISPMAEAFVLHSMYYKSWHKPG
ncbi:hypothetical protein GC194_07055 [bacterium]|nr:hypothetical protein [bacterium]